MAAVAQMWTMFNLAFVAFAAGGAWCDARTRRIPNRLVLAGLLAALALRALQGWGPLGQGAAGFSIALAVGVPLFLLRAMGGGDVKFLAACGAFVGLPLVGKAALWAGVAGGLLAMSVIARKRLPYVAWGRVRDLATWFATAGRAGDRITLQDEGALTAPFGVAIAIGALLAWFGTAGGWIP